MGFRHLFRGLTPLKIENFDQKVKTSTTTQKFHEVYTDKQQLLPLFIIPLKSKISFFFGFCHLFRGLTPLKIENFDQKVKTSTTTQIFS